MKKLFAIAAAAILFAVSAVGGIERLPEVLIEKRVAEEKPAGTGNGEAEASEETVKETAAAVQELPESLNGQETEDADEIFYVEEEE